MEAVQKYSESELVMLLKQRSQPVYSYLYDNYAGALYNTIVGIVTDTELANDVLQEVFIKIWRQIDSYDTGRGRLFTWMLNIARNASIDTVRSKGFQNSRANQELTDHVADTAGSVETKTDTIGLRKIVAQLKQEWRVLVELSYFQGYTQDEIAGMLQIPLGTVKTRMRSAIQQLSKQLKEK